VEANDRDFHLEISAADRSNTAAGSSWRFPKVPGSHRSKCAVAGTYSTRRESEGADSSHYVNPRPSARILLL